MSVHPKGPQVRTEFCDQVCDGGNCTLPLGHHEGDHEHHSAEGVLVEGMLLGAIAQILEQVEIDRVESLYWIQREDQYAALSHVEMYLESLRDHLTVRSTQ